MEFFLLKIFGSLIIEVGIFAENVFSFQILKKQIGNTVSNHLTSSGVGDDKEKMPKTMQQNYNK